VVLSRELCRTCRHRVRPGFTPNLFSYFWGLKTNNRPSPTAAGGRRLLFFLMGWLDGGCGINDVDASGSDFNARCLLLCSDQLRDQGGQGPQFYPTGHPLGPGGSWSGLGVVRGVQLGPWAAGFGGKIALHKAASEVRYVVIFNNGSPTEPNGVSELSLAPHRAAVLTTKHSPAG
jgi:hypothetical protein